ncbi:phosphomannomutase CpsG [Paraperlucidibaca sp.]|jgi:phosphomannomutase|uniref:phosphomannomutase CpsG n=1 Tax=Paraperlucidibaca sp. TaxID=2708021 RepID=UPI0039890233
MTTPLQKLPAFKAYDVRGPVPAQLHIDMVYAIGRAYARVIQPQGPVAIGYDIRDTSEDFARALAAGLNAEGVATRDIGLAGTEMVYHAAGSLGLNGEDMGGGVMITASHNPVGDNGIKMVRYESRPISGDDGLAEMEVLTRQLLNEQAAEAGVQSYSFGPLTNGDQYQADPQLHAKMPIADTYREKVRSFVDFPALKSALEKRQTPLKVVVNAGNGCAGPFFDNIAEGLKLDITRVFHTPDGQFPNGVPNPMLAKCQEDTASVVREQKADLGIAWDGDFDRCFFFDETGAFIEGYYLVALLGTQLLKYEPNGAVCYDTRLTWNTIAQVEAMGGRAVVSKCGHSFIKGALRREGAVYGGEMSAHHYFRDFYCCDSGMIPWLLLLERLTADGKPLSSLVAEAQAAYPCSGEINFKVDDAAAALNRVDAAVQAEVKANNETLVSESMLDGVSREFEQWRFNLRMSNTEPVVRLNVESRGDSKLMQAKTDWLRALITA